jgi:hypothetical protein
MVTDFSFIEFLSMAVAFAAFGTTIVIAHRQGKQTEELASATNEIHDMTSEQTKLTTDTRDFYAAAFVGYVRLISNSYGHVIDLYQNKYYGKPMSQEKTNISKMLMEYYDNHLTKGLPKIEAIELVKTFGREIADKHWTHTAKLTSNMWQAYSDHGMALMIYSYKEQMYKLMELKNAFLEYCEESFKERDSDFQENYDLIGKDFTDSEKPKREDFDSSVNF